MLEPARSMSARRFNRSTGEAKRAALQGPLYITDRGRPSHVLVSYDHYTRLVEDAPSLVDILCSTPGIGTVDLPIPAREERARPARVD